jgi:hypothetical protein
MAVVRRKLQAVVVVPVLLVVLVEVSRVQVV